MVRAPRLRPTYANVTATLALVVALGGGAYAASALPANSVGPTQLRKSAVLRSKIKNNAVDGSKVLDNSLRGTDIKESSLTQVPLAKDSIHAASAVGLDRVIYKTQNGTAPPNAPTSATATCDAGLHVVGGGVKVNDPANGFIVDSYPDAESTAWTGHALGGGYVVYAICAKAVVTG